jgi:hypothetical protein
MFWNILFGMSKYQPPFSTPNPFIYAGLGIFGFISAIMYLASINPLQHVDTLKIKFYFIFL